MNVLVGYTGFVGSNIYAKGEFDQVFNSKNIEQAYGLNPDLLIHAGLPAEKYLANHAPDKDMQLIVNAERNIQQINPKKLVLISTIDVFKNPKDVDEDAKIDTEGLHAYGYNRYILECWVRENYPDALIVRLPGLFGKNLKKNFVYDYIHYVPFMLKEEKMNELTGRDNALKKYYSLQDNGFYKVRSLTGEEHGFLKEKFKSLGFSALNFTDSRNVYQFYPLMRLWDDIQIALKRGMKLWHPATEPISAGELYYYLTGEEFVNEIADVPVFYDYKTRYSELFGGEGGYIAGKNEILREIKRFVSEESL